MDNFFFHENQEAPPAPLTGGEMPLGDKADLLHCLESDLIEDNVNNHAPIPDATSLDGAVVVQILNTNASRTFQEFGESLFAPYAYST